MSPSRPGEDRKMADRWRKKPVVIEAHQLDGTFANGHTVVAWIKGAGGQVTAHRSNPRTDSFDGLSIETLEGVMRANPGDWIIRGVKGEFYPCAPDIFAATYEPCDDSTPEHP